MVAASNKLEQIHTTYNPLAALFHAMFKGE